MKRQSIEVPLMLRYHMLNKRLTPHVDAGLTIMGQTAKTLEAAAQQRNWWVHVHAQLGVGADYDISERINLSFTPTLRYGLSMMPGDSDPGMASVGFVAEVSYRLPRKD